MGTIDYYNENSKDFFDRTINVDMSPIYNRFEKYLFPGGHILEAGCGVGRDVKYFLSKGYKVTAFDASEEMVRIAKSINGNCVSKMEFKDLNYNGLFDAVWASASLLHVPKKEINTIFNKIIDSLKVNGIWHLSLQNGPGEEFRDGPLYNDYTIESLTAELRSYNKLELLEIWLSPDRRTAAPDKWLNAIVKRVK